MGARADLPSRRTDRPTEKGLCELRAPVPTDHGAAEAVVPPVLPGRNTASKKHLKHASNICGKVGRWELSAPVRAC